MANVDCTEQSFNASHDRLAAAAPTAPNKTKTVILPILLSAPLSEIPKLSPVFELVEYPTGAKLPAPEADPLSDWTVQSSNKVCAGLVSD